MGLTLFGGQEVYTGSHIQILAPRESIAKKVSSDAGFIMFSRREEIPDLRNGSELIAKLAHYSPEWRIEVTEQGLKLEPVLLRELKLSEQETIRKETAGIVKVHLDKGLISPGDKVYIQRGLSPKEIRRRTKQLAEEKIDHSGIFQESLYYSKVEADFQLRFPADDRVFRKFTYLIVADEYVNILGTRSVLERHWAYQLIRPYSILIPVPSIEKAFKEIKRLSGKVDLVIPDWDWGPTTHQQLQEGFEKVEDFGFKGVLANAASDYDALMRGVTAWFDDLLSRTAVPPAELGRLYHQFQHQLEQESILIAL